MGLREAVEQEQRRTFTAMADEDRCFAGLNFGFGEGVEHVQRTLAITRSTRGKRDPLTDPDAHGRERKLAAGPL